MARVKSQPEDSRRVSSRQRHQVLAAQAYIRLRTYLNHVSDSGNVPRRTSPIRRLPEALPCIPVEDMSLTKSPRHHRRCSAARQSNWEHISATMMTPGMSPVVDSTTCCSLFSQAPKDSKPLRGVSRYKLRKLCFEKQRDFQGP